MYTTRLQSGYSLVEALIAITILMIAIIGPMTIASQGIKSSRFSLEQNAAFFLAQEGIEAIFSIKNDYALKDINDGLESGDDNSSWDWLDQKLAVTGPCNTSFSSNGDSCSFGVDFHDQTVSDNLTTSLCSSGSESNCVLYTNLTDAPAVYSHQSSGGTVSPYTRIVTVTRESAESVEVTSTVTWNSQVFGGATQSLVLTTHMFDSNYE